jgi:hypothetical protein
MKNRVDKSQFKDLSTKVTEVTRQTSALETAAKTTKTTLQEHGSKLTNLQKNKADKRST